MKVFIHEYGMALLSILMCVFLMVTASPVSTQIQGAMTDVVNQTTDVANFDDLEIISDGSIGSYNDKKVLKAELSCSKTTSNDDLSGQKELFTVTVTYSDNTSEEIPAADIISINKIKEDNSGTTYTATVKGEKKNFNTSELTIDKITPIYAGYNPNDSTLYFANTTKELENVGINIKSSYYFGNIQDNGCKSAWNSYSNNVNSVDFLSEIKPTSCIYWFYYFRNLTKINHIENLNTEKCKNMAHMFDGCYSLGSLDVSYFNTQNVENMDSMFNNCSSISTLNVNGFNTDKVTNMNSMFSLCRKLITLDISNFNTSKVTNISSMFNETESLKILNIGEFNITNVTNKENMFKYVSSSIKIYTTSQKTKDFLSTITYGTVVLGTPD